MIAPAGVLVLCCSSYWYEVISWKADMPPPPSMKQEVSSSGSTELRRRPILVVEDDPVDQELIGLAFQRAAVENPIVTVGNGYEALKYLQAQERSQAGRTSVLPAVIILDLDMPQMDGFEFLRRVKAEPFWASIPIVVLTTSQFDGDLTQSYALGASSCLTKPGDFEELVVIASDVDRYWCRTNRIPENG
jgi:CheY-like chemotaxis protein